MLAADDAPLPPAVRAFDAIAADFDSRFGAWASVAAQRRAVRRILLGSFPKGASLLELGGGTGEDALFLAAHGRSVHLTDGAPEMVRLASGKARATGLAASVVAERVAIEELDAFADRRQKAGESLFDGCYSNFAAFNCVADVSAAGRALGRLVKPGGHALLVVFGPFSPGEVLTFLLRGNAQAALRRLSRKPVRARVGGSPFAVTYPSPRAFARAFAPFFLLRSTLGVGVFVPPSSAEPLVSRFPRLLSLLEAMDRLVARPLALLGDHVLLDLVRTEAP
jgi:SAM-dependent methyltransferase